MPAWLLLTIVALIFMIAVPILNNKSVQVHGPIVNLFVASIVFLVFTGSALILNYDQLWSVTKKSLGINVLASCLAFIAAMSTLYAYKIASTELSIITITISFHVVLVAVANHFLGNKMEFHQWVGAAVAFLGVVLVNWKR